jgi:hypothetical protein
VWGGTSEDERRIMRLLRQQQHHPA